MKARVGAIVGLASYWKTAGRAWPRYEPAILKFVGAISALGLWQLVVAVGLISPRFVSSPTRVFVVGVVYVKSHQFLLDARTSGLEFAGGFGLAVIVGIALGFAMGRSRRLANLLDPVINFLYASPRIALAPLLILWFGIGIESKIAVVFLMSVFPIVINTMLGVHSVQEDLVDLARSLNASRWQLMRTIVVPSSLPFIVTGMRIGLGVGLIGVVVGEFVAATAGIGYTIAEAASDYNVNLVFVGLIIVGAAGVILTEALRYVELKVAKWRVH